MSKNNFNERTTENIIRQHFQQDPLFNIIKFEEQKTSNSVIKNCLSKASKNKTNKPGFPEFIITAPAYPNDVIIVECKANEKYHESKTKDKINDYAVDGIMHYAKFLKKEFNVWCIAASGQIKETLKISNFYLEKNSNNFSKEDNQLIDIFSYITKIKGEFEAKKIESEEITRIAIELNKELNDYSIPEYERCTLISAILLALQDNSFRKSYQNDARTQNSEPKPDRLAKAIVESIRRVLQDNQIDDYRVQIMINEYNSIRNRNLANKKKIKKKKAGTLEPNFVIRNITKILDEKILPLMHMGDKGYDVLGRFYTEFIRYAGTDKKTGLVLTPKHIAELFCDFVNLNTNDIVVDTCCGTGSFLIASMKRMLAIAKNDLSKKNQIKSKQLIGIENRTDMFTYACSNMIMSGDGKSNIFQGDCFSEDQKKKVLKFKPTVAFLNPPYDVGEDGQLEFIENALKLLQQGGRCAAIVQMSCATSSNENTVKVKSRLLEKHKLKAVLSMPNEVFSPIGVITCIMIFEAHTPHPKLFETFFGYFKNDGFIKRKKLGRIDGGNWEDIKNTWLENFINSKNEPGLSITKKINPEDEWCAEAYMETDYSKINDQMFEKKIKEFVAYKFLSES